MIETYRLNHVLRQYQWDIFYGTGHTWAIIIVAIGIGIAIYLGKKMDYYQKRITSSINAEERFSKKSLEAWRNTMFSSWKLGLGSLVPTGIVFGIAHNLPDNFLTAYVFSNGEGFRYAEAFSFVQALVFFACYVLSSER